MTSTNGIVNGSATNGLEEGISKRQKLASGQSCSVEMKYKEGFEFLRQLADVAINDGIIGAMDRDK